MRTLLEAVLEACPVKVPKGRSIGLKSVDADFESSRGFVWPFPGGRAVSPKKPKMGGPCPAFKGDGLCVGLTAYGLAQGGHRLSTALIVSYTKTYGSDEKKVRVAWADVHAVVDMQKLARRGVFSGANLRGADLSGANLSGAYLGGADLSRANLYGAGLSGADLSGAYLGGANLSRANLGGAYLGGADLSRANLYGANLRGADLSRANLYDAGLSGADLSRAIDRADAIKGGALL